MYCHRQMGDVIEMQITHPLLHKWDFWYYRQEAGKDWIDCNQRISSFHTVEDFWGAYDHMERASLILTGHDYAVFKESITPMWEDERNKSGGRWILEVPNVHKFQFLDKLWLQLLQLMVGENFFEHGSDVCGAVVNIRKNRDRISLWTSDSSNTSAIKPIGKIVEDTFREIYPEMQRMKYVPHRETIFHSMIEPELSSHSLD